MPGNCSQMHQVLKWIVTHDHCHKKNICVYKIYLFMQYVFRELVEKAFQE